MRELGFAVLAIIAAVMPSAAYDTSLEKTYWIGGDEGQMFEAANWSKGFSEGNWKNTPIAVFANSATVNVDSKHSFFRMFSSRAAMSTLQLPILPSAWA